MKAEEQSIHHYFIDSLIHYFIESMYQYIIILLFH